MTYQDFLAALRETRGQWTLNAGTGAITFTADRHSCPYLVVRVRRQRGDFDIEGVGRATIFGSADNHTSDSAFDPDVRADLIEACGLTEWS